MLWTPGANKKKVHVYMEYLNCKSQLTKTMGLQHI